MSTWVSPSALARTSSADQSGFCAASLSRLASQVVGSASRTGRSPSVEMSACGIAGGSSRTSVAGRIPFSRQAAAVIPPQLWPTIWTRARPGPPPGSSGHVGGVVAEPMVTLPVSGQTMPRLIERDDPPAVCGQGRPDPPPDTGRGRDPVDQYERPVGGIAPRQGRERDPGRCRSSIRVSARGSARSSAAATAGGRSAAVATIAAGEVADIGSDAITSSSRRCRAR